MSAAERFVDTNVLLYLLSGDQRKADRAEEVLAGGATISVQVLNEFASVASRMSLTEVQEALEPIKLVCTVVPLTVAIHERALKLAQRHRFAIYDALIVGAALEHGCAWLCTEDLQDGQVIEKSLTIRNPFRQ